MSSSKFYSQKIFKVSVIVACLGFLVFLNPYNFFNPFRSLFLRIIYPFQKISYSVSIKTRKAGEIFFNISDLKKNNEELIRQNQELMSENAKLRDMKSENEILREQLELLPRESLQLEAASVVSQDSYGLGNWIEIDKGEKDGLEKDMTVIVSNGLLVGKVQEVYAKNSKVILITNPESVINVVDQETGAKGVVRGEFGLGAVMDMVLQSDSLNKGDQIITSGIGGRIPRGMLVGKVSEISQSSDRLFQKAALISPIKFSKLEFVFVVKN